MAGIEYEVTRQGIGRHTADEVFARGMREFDALSVCLGDEKYFLGDQPTTLDTCAFGVLVHTGECPIDSTIKQYGSSKSNLANCVPSRVSGDTERWCDEEPIWGRVSRKFIPSSSSHLAPRQTSDMAQGNSAF